MSGIFDQIINYSPPLIVSGTVNYKGTWNASTNNPTLNSSPASSTKGDYYIVNTAGTQFSISFAVGDWIISNGTAWDKVDLTDAVSSVFGRTGAVVGVSTDYSAVGITNTAIGATNPSTGAFTTLSASTPIGISSGGTNASSAGQALAKLNPITTTVTSGTPVTLTNASTPVQVFTGSTVQTVLLPVTSTLEVGWVFTIINNSTQNIPVQTSAGTALLTVLANANAVFRCIATGSTAVTDWEAGLTEFSLVTGTGAVVLQNSPTLFGALNLTGGATANASLATALTTGTLTIGSTTQTGLTIIGQSTQSSTLQIGAGVTASGNTNTIQIGTLGASGSTTAITIGSAANTSSVAVNGTLSASGLITSTVAGGSIFYNGSAGTLQSYLRLSNTSGNMFLGINGSSGGAIITGASAYDTILTGQTGIAFSGDNGTAMQMRLTSTGLAVTGALSATGIISSTAGGEIPLRISGGGTGAQVLRVQTTGGDYFFGAERSAGNYFIAGSTGYDTIIRGPSGIAFSANAGSNMQMRLSSTGLAVAGTLSTLATNGVNVFESAGVSSVGLQFKTNSTNRFKIETPSASADLAFYAGGTTEVARLSSTGLAVTGALSCTGALSKGSGSFRIEHPLPEKSATHQLVHSFIEGPQADLIYRGKVVLIDGKASVNIDAAATMTEGTFEVLCRDVQCFVTNNSNWSNVRGTISGNILTIECEDAFSSANVSWMVIGERKDPHMMETDWTDNNGKVIVEPLKPVQPIE